MFTFCWCVQCAPFQAAATVAEAGPGRLQSLQHQLMAAVAQPLGSPGLGPLPGWVAAVASSPLQPGGACRAAVGAGVAPGGAGGAEAAAAHLKELAAAARAQLAAVSQVRHCLCACGHGGRVCLYPGPALCVGCVAYSMMQCQEVHWHYHAAPRSVPGTGFHTLLLPAVAAASTQALDNAEAAVAGFVTGVQDVRSEWGGASSATSASSLRGLAAPLVGDLTSLGSRLRTLTSRLSS
jgi:hypothetical protein